MLPVRAGQSSPAKGPGAAADKATEQKGKQEETKIVPPKLIHVSNPDQDNPKPKGWNADDRDRYEEIRGAAKRGGPSNVLLVHGDDFRWAVWSTWQAYNHYGTYTAENALPARDPDPEKKDDPDPPKDVNKSAVWVVAYLGTDTSDRWLIKSVERTGNRVRVSYTDRYKNPGGVGATVGDSTPYIMWAPLGRLDAGKYTLELYETNEMEVKLTRLVLVK